MGQPCDVATMTAQGLWVALQVQTVVQSNHCGILTVAVLDSVHGHFVQGAQGGYDWQICDNTKMPQRG